MFKSISGLNRVPKIQLVRMDPVQKLKQTPDRGRLNLPLKEALLKQPEPRSELTIFSHNSILFIWGLRTSGK